jgi:hypothetical protein
MGWLSSKGRFLEAQGTILMNFQKAGSSNIGNGIIRPDMVVDYPAVESVRIDLK